MKILGAAKRCFKFRGYKRTTLEDIATEAEFSPSIIYGYFKNKADLYASVLLGILEYLYRKFVNVMSQDIKKRDVRIEAMIKVVMDLNSEYPDLTIHLFHLLSEEERQKPSEENLEKIRGLIDKIKTIAAIIILGEGRTGESKYTDPEMLADIFWPMFIGMAIYETCKINLYQKKIERRPKLETIFDLLKKGIQGFSSDGFMEEGHYHSDVDCKDRFHIFRNH